MADGLLIGSVVILVAYVAIVMTCVQIKENVRSIRASLASWKSQS